VPPGAGAMHVPREFVLHLDFWLVSIPQGGLVSEMMTLAMSCDS